MNKSIVKIKFLSPIHIGNKNLSESEYTIKADTLFSALCLQRNDIDLLVQSVKNGKLKISDALPYIDDYYYIPKPLIYVPHQAENYKLFKKVKYIAEDSLEHYIAGTLFPEDEIKSFLLGKGDLRQQLCVGSDPFAVGIYTFNDNAGLYVIVEHENTDIFELFERLSYAGIGGKRSSGLGRFEFSQEPCFEFSSGENKILLNSAMAQKHEMEKALSGANYLLQKRSGFINQSKYKKQDFYTFVAGSVFKNEFEGDIFNVGNDEHPVYNYAVPMFMGVNK